MVYEIVDLRTGRVVVSGECVDELKKGLPEGIYEVRKNGKCLYFYSVINDDERTWI